MSKEALIVIDLQTCYLTHDYNDLDIEYKIAKYNKTILNALRNDVEIIYIKNIYTTYFMKTIMKLFFDGIGIEKSEGLELHKNLEIVTGNIFTKNKPNSFKMNDLENFFKNKEISKLNVMGIDGSYCVHDTAMGAMRLGIDVNMIDDLCFSFNSKLWRKKKKSLIKNNVKFVNSDEIFKMSETEKTESDKAKRSNSIRI